MHIETEKKFLVLDDGFKAQAVKSYRIRQGYLAHDSGRTVRVRIRDDKGFLTIKGPEAGPNGRRKSPCRRPRTCSRCASRAAWTRRAG